MCGRFAMTATTEDIENLLPELGPDAEIEARYNIAPTQNIAAILGDGSGKIRKLRWGLVPFWADDPSIGNRMINARGETLNEKPSFKKLIKSRRCLIIATGFYEWKKSGKEKIPYYIKMKDGKPFTFAGLWDVWNKGEEPLTTATIITTVPNEMISDIHNRMPAIIMPEHRELWLSTETVSIEMLLAAIGPYPADEMEAYPVSKAVNNPRNDYPELLNNL
ncbi:MAG: SOS response-associated peptidase [Candidatus Kapaibacterium sp.]